MNCLNKVATPGSLLEANAAKACPRRARGQAFGLKEFCKSRHYFSAPGSVARGITQPAGSGQQWAMHRKPGPFKHFYYHGIHIAVGSEIPHGQ